MLPRYKHGVVDAKLKVHKSNEFFLYSIFAQQLFHDGPGLWNNQFAYR